MTVSVMLTLACDSYPLGQHFGSGTLQPPHVLTCMSAHRRALASPEVPLPSLWETALVTLGRFIWYISQCPGPYLFCGLTSSETGPGRHFPPRHLLGFPTVACWFQEGRMISRGFLIVLLRSSFSISRTELGCRAGGEGLRM